MEVSAGLTINFCHSEIAALALGALSSVPENNLPSSLSRRDGVIVAWHEVPGTAPPQKSRPVGYGLICAGMPTDSMIGVISLP